MSALSTHDDLETDAAGAGVEFGRSTEAFPVARIGDMVLAMLPLAEGEAYLASACFVRRPLNELKRADFYGHDGRLADEDEFRRRVHETAEHRRELNALGRVQTRMAASTPSSTAMPARIRRGLSRNCRRPASGVASSGRLGVIDVAGMVDPLRHSFTFSRSLSSFMNSPISRKCRYTDANRT